MADASQQEITDFALEEGVRLTGSTMGYLAFLSEDETVMTMHSWSKSAMQECAIIDKPIVYPVAEHRPVGRGRAAAQADHHQRLRWPPIR